MAYLPTGAQARERAQDNNLLAQQISILEIAVLDAIASGAFEATVSNTSTVVIQGSTITGSPMTDNDVLGQSYYSVWQASTTDAVKTEQMNEVIEHFKAKGYTISRKSTSGTYFYWHISW